MLLSLSSSKGDSLASSASPEMHSRDARHVHMHIFPTTAADPRLQLGGPPAAQRASEATDTFEGPATQSRDDASHALIVDRQLARARLLRNKTVRRLNSLASPALPWRALAKKKDEQGSNQHEEEVTWQRAQLTQSFVGVLRSNVLRFFTRSCVSMEGGNA